MFNAQQLQDEIKKKDEEIKTLRDYIKNLERKYQFAKEEIRQTHEMLARSDL